MAFPTNMQPYEYQFKETGFRLNTTAAMPFIDIEEVTGLDMLTYESKIDTIDGRHGGSVSVKYMPARTVILDGFLYADAVAIDSVIHTLNANYAPNNVPDYFFFTESSGTMRWLWAKSLGIKVKQDRDRSRGVAAVQIQLAAEDPRKYVNNADQTMVAGTNYTPANPGTIETYATFQITGAWSTINLINTTQNRTVTLTNATPAGAITIVDMRTREVYINGVLKSSIVTTGQWWEIPVGGGQQVRYTVSGGTPSVVLKTRQGWI